MPRSRRRACGYLVAVVGATRLPPPRLFFVCSDILREPTHHKTTRAFFEQPLIVLERIGDAGQVDQGGHGSVQ